jgi:hypothetical protein
MSASAVINDSTVIDQFVGDYESDGNVPVKEPETVHYYPDKGVKLTLEKVPINGKDGKPDKDGRAYAKITINEDVKPVVPFPAKLKLERAVFTVQGNALIADNIEIGSGLLLQEKLTMQKSSSGDKEMLHTLSFSNGSKGTWICKT